MIIDCLADLHGHYPELEGGDLLIVAGDLTGADTFLGWKRFLLWLHSQKYKEKIFIAGNHDNRLINGIETGAFPEGCNYKYLRDSGTEFEGLKIWGSPWTKTFPGINPKCKAFTVDTEEELAEKWANIPDDTDILITHGPMLHMLDQNIDGYHCGSSELRKVVDRIKPRVHVFGHIHENGGKKMIFKRPGYGTENNTICVNASYVDERYKPMHKPVRIEL